MQNQLRYAAPLAFKHCHNLCTLHLQDQEQELHDQLTQEVAKQKAESVKLQKEKEVNTFRLYARLLEKFNENEAE
jgi:hypothetical protein